MRTLHRDDRRSVSVLLAVVVTIGLQVAFPANLKGAVDDDAHLAITVRLSRDCPEAHRTTQDAIAATDAAVAALVRQFGNIAERPAGQVTATIQVYARESAYARAVRRIGAVRFEENLAVTDYERAESHVVLQPTRIGSVIQAIGLPLLTRRQIAHEAAHLWCDARWPNDYRSAPRWLREGLATWASEAAMRSLNAITRAEDDPFLSTRIVLAQRAAGRLTDAARPSSMQDPFAAFDVATTYAFDWAWCRMYVDAANRRGDDVSSVAKSDVSIESLVKEFANRPGMSMQALTDYVRSMRPEWEQEGRSLEIHGTDWYQMAFRDAAALAWRTRGPASVPYRIRGTLHIPDKAADHASVVFARDAQGHLAVVLRPSAGFAISEFSQKSGQWRELARAAASRSSSGPIQFQIVVKPGSVRLEIDGRRVCEADTGDKRLIGPWGVSVPAGGAARWHGVEVVQDLN